MDVQSIKTFIQVANLKNFTKAAEELNYAQSTVTAQIQRLEEELGFPLFERIGRKNYLTAGGEAFLSHATEILHIIQQASSLGQELKEMKGTLRVGTLESLMFVGVLPIIPAFRAAFPNVDIAFKIGQASELTSMLKQDQLDLAYISQSPNIDPTLQCQYRRRESMIFIAGRNHPLAKREKIPVEEALAYPFIMAEKTGRCYGRLMEIVAEHQMVFRDAVIIDNIAAILTLLRDDLSISFLPEYALLPELEEGSLVKLDVDTPEQLYYSQILCHKNKWHSPFISRFIEMIRETRPENEDKK